MMAMQDNGFKSLHIHRDTGDNDPGSGFGGGASAGIVIAVVVVVAASAGFAYWWFVMKSKDGGDENAEP
jgi:flagellar basal body-associated protein FliL